MYFQEPHHVQYMWKWAAADVTSMAHACLTCQQGKIIRHIHVEPQHIQVLPDVSATSTWIWWAPFQLQRASHTCSK